MTANKMKKQNQSCTKPELSLEFRSDPQLSDFKAVDLQPCLFLESFQKQEVDVVA